MTLSDIVDELTTIARDIDQTMSDVNDGKTVGITTELKSIRDRVTELKRNLPVYDFRSKGQMNDLDTRKHTT